MLAEGSVINGRYRLAERIGEGGMASVWKAHDETLNRAVAIKLLYLRVHGDPQAGIDQFLREARLAAAVQHRNVIHTVDFGTDAEGTPFIVMELLQGESLAARMERAPALSLEELTHLAEMTLRGLAAVHDAGIVHRDLTPQNIFLQRDADAVYPKILDFGISRSVGATGRSSALVTQPGLVIGTPHYMAPEQARGDAAIDARADIYSLGAILYEAIAGRPPFDAGTPGELLVKIISSEPTPLRRVRPDVPEALAHCVGQAMARDRGHRFVDARAFREALQLAMQRAFPASAHLRVSGLPARAVGDRLQVSQQPELPSARANTVQQGPAPGWGDFENFAGRANPAAPARAVSPVPSPPLAGAPHPDAAVRAPAVPLREAGAAPKPTAKANQTAPRRDSAGRPRVGAPPAIPTEASAQERLQGGPMLGDNPLDVFAGAGDAGLELAFEAPVALAVIAARKAQDATERRAPAGQQARGALQQVSTRASGALARRPSVVWAVPAVLLLLLALFVVCPSWFSLAPPDQAAASAREARQSATRGSSRTLQSARGEPVGPSDVLAPALRELQ